MVSSFRRSTTGILATARALAKEGANAGVQHVAPIEEFPRENWDPIIAINLSAAFHAIADTMAARNMTREQVIHDVILGAQPTKQFVPADGVASQFVYLCSDAAAQITGANYSFDGGRTA